MLAMTAAPANLTADEAAAEFRRLYPECAAAIGYANAVLQTDGGDSDSFREADRRAAALWQRLREVQGLMVKRWLA
jgi:hypothetical protein